MLTAIAITLYKALVTAFLFYLPRPFWKQGKDKSAALMFVLALMSSVLLWWPVIFSVSASTRDLLEGAWVASIIVLFTPRLIWRWHK